MRKDIEIPEVRDVYVAAILERIPDGDNQEWYTYLINDGEEALETVLIVSRGYDDQDVTSVMRHSLEVLPARGFARVEFLEQHVLRLSNYFSVTFFIGKKLYEKNYVFPADSICSENFVELPVMNRRGVLAR